jgi:hypothetical protein
VKARKMKNIVFLKDNQCQCIQGIMLKRYDQMASKTRTWQRRLWRQCEEHAKHERGPHFPRPSLTPIQSFRPQKLLNVSQPIRNHRKQNRPRKIRPGWEKTKILVREKKVCANGRERTHNLLVQVVVAPRRGK